MMREWARQMGQRGPTCWAQPSQQHMCPQEAKTMSERLVKQTTHRLASSSSAAGSFVDGGTPLGDACGSCAAATGVEEFKAIFVSIMGSKKAALTGHHTIVSRLQQFHQASSHPIYCYLSADECFLVLKE